MNVKKIEVRITMDDGQSIGVELDDVTRWSWDLFHELRERGRDQLPSPSVPAQRELEKTGRATFVVSGAGRVVK